MKFAQLFLQKIPYALGFIPYFLSYRAAEFLLKDQYTQVWGRNSYILKRLNPGLSDIDLTLFFKKECNKSQIKKKIARYQRLKKYFVLWGEVNSYSEEELKFMSQFLNPFERERDPILQNLLNCKFSSPSLESKFVYILRMLKADGHNLNKHPELRKNKWVYHFQQVGLPYTPQLTEQIIQELIRPLNLSLDEQIFQNFLKIDESSDELVNDFYLPLNSRERRSFVLLFPLRWLVVSLRNHQFEQDIQFIKSFNSSEQTLLLEHLRWELIGIYSQYHQLTLTVDLSKHLKNIEKILESLTIHEACVLKEAYQELENYINNYKQE